MGLMLNSAKIFWLCFWAILATCLLFFPIVMAALFSRTGNLAFRLTKIWAWIILRITRVRPVVRGREKIEKDQSYVVIANHQSQFDILAIIAVLGIQFRWIIKRELLKVPLFGYALYTARNIFIDRSNRQTAINSIRRGMNRLPSGVSVLFFAEGTRSHDGRIHEFKKGGFITAIEEGLPILPITVNGSRNVLPKGHLVFHSGRIEVIVADPIDTGMYVDQADALIEMARDIIIGNFKPDFAEA